jgi:hypothetical protein
MGRDIYPVVALITVTRGAEVAPTGYKVLTRTYSAAKAARIWNFLTCPCWPFGFQRRVNLYRDMNVSKKDTVSVFGTGGTMFLRNVVYLPPNLHGVTTHKMNIHME